jgi:hypothetical protein
VILCIYMQFEEDQQFSRNMYDTTPKGLSGWLINKGIVKDMKSANIVLLVSSVIFVVATIAVINRDSFGGGITQEEIYMINSQLSPDDPAFLE